MDMKWTTGEEEHILQFLIPKHMTLVQQIVDKLTYHPHAADAVQMICENYGCGMEDLMKPGGIKSFSRLANCRATVIDILNDRQLFNMGLVEISRAFFGGRDHTTLLYIRKNHYLFDLTYMTSVHRVCMLIGVSYLETVNRLEASHIPTNGTKTNRRNSRTAGT
jgi:hypothetical protein